LVEKAILYLGIRPCRCRDPQLDILGNDWTVNEMIGRYRVFRPAVEATLDRIFGEMTGLLAITFSRSKLLIRRPGALWGRRRSSSENHRHELRFQG